MTILIVAFCLGIIAGLRSMTAPALASWAARLGLLPLGDTWLAFLGYRFTPWVLSVLALGELVVDKLPGTPSRKAPPSFIARIVTGSLSGAAVTLAHGSALPGLIAGALGAVLGTLGGYELRSRLVRATGGRDLPIALLEDLIAVAGGIILLRATL